MRQCPGLQLPFVPLAIISSLSDGYARHCDNSSLSVGSGSDTTHSLTAFGRVAILSIVGTVCDRGIL